MTKEEPVKGKSVGAVLNALSILRYVSHRGTPAGVNQIARGTGVSVSSCFNILGTLLHERLVTFDESTKAYSPGLGLLELAVPLLSANPADLTTPEIEQLSRKHNCLICLWNFTADERIVLSNRASASRTVRVDMNLGARLPAYAGAVGRCYAALKGTSDANLRTAFEKLHWQKAPDFQDYLSDVRAARENGFAFDIGNLFTGLEIAASIVRDGSGHPRYGLSGISIAGQMSPDQIRDMAVDLRETANDIGRALFGLERAG
ncbi:MAG: IclR family transcriptional regulator [Rhodospirillum sp.]|nr:IclR family transcriptional regulator [Rhodospirillum sp.]MCF8489476.1 IclR family transcriptional regulator [Rhodospirillum sp.]MCF8500808.1 IclR family transcriptional regulator [Rhodospirillum sp.]